MGRETDPEPRQSVVAIARERTAVLPGAIRNGFAFVRRDDVGRFDVRGNGVHSDVLEHRGLRGRQGVRHRADSLVEERQ